MSLSELKKQLKENRLGNLYLFCGEEEYLKQYYLNELVSTVLSGAILEFNHIVFEGNKLDLEEINQAIESLPMMADKKIVLIKDSGFFKKTVEQTKKFWEARISDIPSHICLVFYETDVDKRGSIYKAILKNGVVAECNYLSESELMGWIGRACANEDKKISKDAANYILFCTDGSMHAVKRELEKLFSYCGQTITIEDAKRLVTRQIQSRVFEMIDAIINKNAANAFFELTQLRQSGENAFGVLALLFSNFQKLLHTKLLLDNGVNQYKISQITGLKPYIANKYIQNAKKFDKKSLKSAVCRCAEIDYGIKQGLFSEWDALTEFLATCISN